MKRTILVLSVLFIAVGSAFAQKAKVVSKGDAVTTKTNKPTGVTQVKADADAIQFVTSQHNFGTIAEGPAVSFDFEFKNTSDKPIQLESVRASCGCTTPFWSKDPIAPGATSKVTATYNTKGRPGNFHKTITVKSSVGQKVLTIKGMVEKAPSSSVPANNNSMIKH